MTDGIIGFISQTNSSADAKIVVEGQCTDARNVKSLYILSVTRLIISQHSLSTTPRVYSKSLDYRGDARSQKNEIALYKFFI